MTLAEFFQDKGTKRVAGVAGVAGATEPTGKLSATRLLLFVWTIGVFVVWAVASWKSVLLQPVPDSVVTIFGLFLGAKAVQRFGED